MTSTCQHRQRERIRCPHCHAPAIVRTSRSITDEVRQLHLSCSNGECGHVFGALAETIVTVTHTIVASKTPRDGVELRQAPPRRRTPVPANDRGPEVPRPANDDVPMKIATG